jgi:hypothetical protein
MIVRQGALVSPSDIVKSLPWLGNPVCCSKIGMLFTVLHGRPQPSAFVPPLSDTVLLYFYYRQARGC